MVAFDWYQATVHAPVDDVLEACWDLTDCPALRHTRGRNGYAHSTVIDGPDGPVGAVWHGGAHPSPHVVFTGDQAEGGSRCIRAAFPQHFVARADPRVDFIDATAYDRIQGLMIDVAREYRVKPGTAGDHLVHKEGRTFMLGSPKSAVRQRLYEKTAEQRAKLAADPIRLATVPENWVRLEAQIRPQTRAAALTFATIDPVDAMGSSRWLRAVWEGVTGSNVEPVQVGKSWRQSDDDRAYSFMLAQYGRLLVRRMAEHGSWPALGAQLGHDLAERAEVKKRGC